MAIPRTEKLISESPVVETVEGPTAYMNVEPAIQHGDKRQIKKLQPLNDMVALWVEPNSSTILMGDKDRYKNEGVVIGYGPSTSQVSIGDVVVFQDKTPYVVIAGQGVYEDERIILMTERFLMLKLKTIEYTLVD